MRISTNTMYESGLARMTESQAKLMKTQQQVATGKRILTPADDPVGAARVLNLTQGQELNAQYAVNRQNARNALSLEENVLQKTTDLIQDVKTLVVQAGNPSYDSTQLKFIAIDLQTRFEELVSIANTRDGMGNYLFSGYQLNTKPYTLSAEGAQYNGDQGRTMMQIDSARQMAIGDSGDQIFDNVPSNGTSEASNIGFSGASRVSVTDARALTGHQYDIVFNAYATTPPMASSAAPGNTGTAVVSPVSASSPPADPSGNSYDIVFSVSGGSMTYSVLDTQEPPTTVMTGTYTAGPADISFDGMQLTIDGVPANGDRMTIRPGTGSGTYSVYDATLDSGRVGVPVATGAYSASQAINFQGMQVTTSGAPDAGDRIEIRPREKQSLFTTLQDLITLLQTQGSGVVGKANLKHGLDIANDSFGKALDNVLSVRASIGSRLKELDNLDEAGEVRNEQYATQISNIEDVDYNRALSDLSKNQIILEAAQKSFAKITGLSLFNLL
jgi:flagellar hook-associated protein 3 FlgL